MAVDNRDFADHVELDGGNVYFEDKKLQEASAVTSGDVSTQHILLKDTDGNIQKIDKASFAAAVKDVLAGILANTDKGTTITNIAAIDNGSFGSVTPANLASVLGVNGKVNSLIVDNFNIGVSWSNSTIDVNAGSRGRTVLALLSSSNDAGDRTVSLIWMLRCGYSDNHITKTNIIEDWGTSSSTQYIVEVGINDGKIAFKANQSSMWHVLLIANK